MTVIGWKVEKQDRRRLLEQFPPTWPDIIADHVTLDARASARTPCPALVSAEIVGEANDGRGLQALVVAINGSTDRPDGSTYHITWSLDRAQGRRPVESNDVIRELGWRRFEQTIGVRLRPARFG